MALAFPKDLVRETLNEEIGIRQWMADYPELFLTRLHEDCFFRIALLTLDTGRLPSLKPLYRSLPHSENAVRAYLRSLANGGWIALERSSQGDRRVVGLRIEPRFREVRDEWLGRQRLSHDGSGKGRRPGTEPPGRTTVRYQP